ncbi:hypothetical protein HY251_06770 [bacterium]|nr:hypothetical protein [bacterium]
MGEKGNLGTAAVRRLERKLRDEPADREAREALVEHFFFAADEARLARHLEALVEHHPGSEAVRHFGLPMAAHGPSAAVERRLRKGVVERPDDPEVRVNLAMHEMFAGLADDSKPIDPERAGRAEGLFREALDLAPDSYEGRLMFAVLLERQGRLAEALDAYVGLAERPHDESGDVIRAQALADASRVARNLGRRRRARSLAEKALEAAALVSGEDRALAPNAVHQAHTTLGHLELARGDVDGAIRHARSSLDIETTPQLGSFGPGTSLIDAIAGRGRTSEAVELLELCRRHVDDDRFRTRIRELGGKPKKRARRRSRP